MVVVEDDAEFPDEMEDGGQKATPTSGRRDGGDEDDDEGIIEVLLLISTFGNGILTH